MSWYKDKVKKEYDLENEKEDKQDACSTREEKQKSFLDEMVEENRIEDKTVKKRGRKPGFSPKKKALETEVKSEKPKPVIPTGAGINFELMTKEVASMKEKLKKYQEKENDSKVYLEFMRELSGLSDKVYDKVSEENDFNRKMKLYKILSEIHNIVVSIANIIIDMR